MDILLANPRGFCAGVDRAIDIVERALEIHGAPIFVRHEVVHNKYVVDELRDKGAVFVEELNEVPDDNTVIFSAHGVSKAVEDEAANRGLQVFDATCPLVTKVHLEVVKYARQGKEVILIGHAGHPEVEGTMGRYDTSKGGRIILVETPDDVADIKVNDPDTLAFVSQTTLSVDDTEEIINTLREMVVGAANSSNSNRLRELGERAGVESHLITRASDIPDSWLSGKETVGVTAGASAPEVLVQEVMDRLKEAGGTAPVEYDGIEETVSFSIPKELRRMDLPS